MVVEINIINKMTDYSSLTTVKVTVDVASSIAYVDLYRPKQMNALDHAMFTDMRKAFEMLS